MGLVTTTSLKVRIFFLLSILFIFNHGQPMIPTSMCGCAVTTLIISSLKDIAILHASWNFYNSDDDHAPTNLTLLIFHVCCVIDFPTPF